MMRIASIFLSLAFIVSFTQCKKQKTTIAVNTKFETQLRSLDVFKMDVLKSGLAGYNYGYPDIKTVNGGELLIVASRFKSIYDNTDGAHLVSIRSFDKGNTWTSPEVIQENIAESRTISPSLIKITEQHLMLTFSGQEDTKEIKLYYKESLDGGYTWTHPIIFSEVKGYNVTNNSAAVYQNNQITVPVAYVAGDIHQNYNKQLLFFYTSNDLGKSWQFGDIIKTNFALMEPYINVFDDGELFVNIRTQSGFIYFARKKYQEDWILYNSSIISSASPQKIYKLPNSDRLIMLWNYTDKRDVPNRSPLSMALSDDRGYTWTHIYDLETKGVYDYAYSAIESDGEYLYLSYYKRPMNNNSNSRSSLVFARIKMAQL